MTDRIDLHDYFKFYKGLPHQVAAVQQLAESMPATLLKPDATWVETYKAAGKQQEPAALSNPIRVPYYSQRDSATQHALRMCFSSSCAMMLEAIRPGTLAGPNGDDAYLGRVLRHGDTVDAGAQIKALSTFGVKATFTQQADFDVVRKQIDKGIPVPLGFLHKGPVSKPAGGGHYLCAIGYDDNGLVVHDPFGECDLIGGTYVNNWGSRLRYSYKNFGPRWMVEGPRTGWAILAAD